MAVACLNHLESRIPTSEIGWFPRGNPVRSSAPFASDSPGQSACAGSELFINALQHVDAIVGNSSSGLYEAPSFGIPTVNIGDRQKGRLRAASVIDCVPERQAIREAVANALARGKQPTVNPYGDGHAAQRMLDILNRVPDFGGLIRKPFFDVIGAPS